MINYNDAHYWVYDRKCKCIKLIEYTEILRDFPIIFPLSPDGAIPTKQRYIDLNYTSDDFKEVPELLMILYGCSS